VDFFGSGLLAGSCEVTKEPLDPIKVANVLTIRATSNF
jgi:hypothetical protein